MEAASHSQFDDPPAERLSFGYWTSTIAALVCGLAIRLWAYSDLFQANGDSLVYGAIAKNLLLHGRYAFTSPNGTIYSTLIRLPGYPLFLAACFRIFGMENYASAAWVQIALDLIACLLLAESARRLAPAQMRTTAMHATLWLAVLCPFTAVYSVFPLTEGPTVFSIALALWAVVRLLEQPHWLFALCFTFGITWAALLRPDGALVAVALAPAVVFALRRRTTPGLLRMTIACMLLVCAPFAAWAWRNSRVFHIFQPLVPASATDPGDPVYPGWERWVKTWSLDFVTTYTVYWEVPDGELDLSQLPSRAFDSSAERKQTQALVDAYNANGFDLTPQLDTAFAQLAAERIAAHPLCYYLWLPLGRVADMWLRPRVDNLNIDLDWWVYAHHNAETRFSWFYAGLNALYLALGIAGMRLRPRLWPAMLAYFVLRSVLLATVAAPETRYTLECFPMLFILGGIAIGRIATRQASLVPPAD